VHLKMILTCLSTEPLKPYTDLGTEMVAGERASLGRPMKLD
jgi:hypothetical protein